MEIICIPQTKESFLVDQEILFNEGIFWNSDNGKKGIYREINKFVENTFFIIRDCKIYVGDKTTVEELIKNDSVYYNNTKIFIRNKKLNKLLKM